MIKVENFTVKQILAPVAATWKDGSEHTTHGYILTSDGNYPKDIYVESLDDKIETLTQGVAYDLLVNIEAWQGRDGRWFNGSPRVFSAKPHAEQQGIAQAPQAQQPIQMTGTLPNPAEIAQRIAQANASKGVTPQAPDPNTSLPF